MNRSAVEKKRLKLQTELDGDKTATERNRLGQFSTPTQLAIDILSYAKELFGCHDTIRFLDPGFGTGTFFSALLENFPRNQVKQAVGFEIDPFYGKPTALFWKGTLLDLRVSDFTMAAPPEADQDCFNLVICNPPYVRHHHITAAEKARLQTRTLHESGMKISGLAGLYCYFLGLSHAWMAEGGLAGWLIPSEFMDVNYGKAVKGYLLNKVTLLRVHRFDPKDLQFGDALVSSAVVWFRKTIPPEHHRVEFTYGGTLGRPKLGGYVSVNSLWRERKWTRFPAQSRKTEMGCPSLGNFFTIKRGIATGDNKFFMLTRDKILEHGLSMRHFRPILPAPRHLSADEIFADDEGNPKVEPALFLLSCALPEETLCNKYPELWRYLETGRTNVSKRYLCQHRSPWYAQEDRPPTPFLCTYMGRGNDNGRPPFRFILNHSRATAANVYLLLYPKKSLQQALQRDSTLKHEVWKILKEIAPESMVNEGRIYGGGLFKLEPKELAAVPAERLAALLPEARLDSAIQQNMFEMSS